MLPLESLKYAQLGDVPQDPRAWLSPPLPWSGGSLDDIIDPQNHLGSFRCGEEHCLLHLESLKDAQLGHVTDPAGNDIDACVRGSVVSMRCP
jgi:hypothetical protein